MMWKALLLFSIVFSANCYSISLTTSYDKSKSVKDTKTVTFDSALKASTVINEMGMGWNLGNSLDSHNSNGLNEGLNSETSWGNPKTTSTMIKKIASKGFKTIRISVTWHNHLVDYSYTIDPNWMKRVKEVVDLCISNGLYVILNTHHDQSDYGVSYGKGYYPQSNQLAESERFLLNIWSQIVVAFNNGYDHHLIFEALNEPRLKGQAQEWWYNGNYECEDAIRSIKEFNNLIHYVIRSSGGNNKLRFLMYTSGAAAFSYVSASSFSLPDDSTWSPKTKRLFASVHMYTPYDFALNGDMGKNTFTDAYKSELESNLQTLYAKFVQNGYYVVIGEMGACDKKNDAERIKWGQYFVERARKLKMVPVVWDNNIYNTNWDANEKFGLFQRSSGTWASESYVNALITASKKY